MKDFKKRQVKNKWDQANKEKHLLFLKKKKKHRKIHDKRTRENNLALGPKKFDNFPMRGEKQKTVLEKVLTTENPFINNKV